MEYAIYKEIFIQKIKWCIANLNSIIEKDFIQLMSLKFRYNYSK